jgi:pimeloyl-ACP methyl ester carboxylesterase
MPQFPAGSEGRVVARAGHFLPREQPAAVVDAMLGLLAKSK